MGISLAAASEVYCPRWLGMGVVQQGHLVAALGQITLAVALGGYSPEARHWRKIDWSWQQEYRAEMMPEGPRLVGVVPNTVSHES